VRRMTLVLAVVAAVGSLVPARAGHCAGISILSAVDSGVGVRRGVATGTVGCTADPTNEALFTGYNVTGVPHLIVAVDKRGAFATAAPRSGSLVVGGTLTRLSFVDNEARWESQSVPNTGGIAAASATATNDSTITITYNAFP